MCPLYNGFSRIKPSGIFCGCLPRTRAMALRLWHAVGIVLAALDWCSHLPDTGLPAVTNALLGAWSNRITIADVVGIQLAQPVPRFDVRRTGKRSKGPCGRYSDPNECDEVDVGPHRYLEKCSASGRRVRMSLCNECWRYNKKE